MIILYKKKGKNYLLVFEIIKKRRITYEKECEIFYLWYNKITPLLTLSLGLPVQDQVF